GTDVERVEGRVVGLGEAVDADDNPATGVDLVLELVRGFGDLALEVAILDALVDTLEHGATAELVEMSEHLLGLTLHRVGQLLDEPRAAEGISHERDAGLM